MGFELVTSRVNYESLYHDVPFFKNADMWLSTRTGMGKCKNMDQTGPALAGIPHLRPGDLSRTETPLAPPSNWRDDPLLPPGLGRVS
jgi:hypothetical protein